MVLRSQPEERGAEQRSRRQVKSAADDAAALAFDFGLGLLFGKMCQVHEGRRNVQFGQHLGLAAPVVLPENGAQGLVPVYHELQGTPQGFDVQGPAVAFLPCHQIGVAPRPQLLLEPRPPPVQGRPPPPSGSHVAPLRRIPPPAKRRDHRQQPSPRGIQFLGSGRGPASRRKRFKEHFGKPVADADAGRLQHGFLLGEDHQRRHLHGKCRAGCRHLLQNGSGADFPEQFG